MKPTKRAAAGLIGAFIACACAGAQVLPPVPPAAPATPPYTPPPPPPPPPTPPPRPEPGAAEKPVTLIDRDETGKLRTYDTSLEEAALARMPLTDEQRAKIDVSLASRRSELEKLVIERLDAVLEARRVGETIGQIREMGELLKIKDTIAKIAPERVVDRLVRDGAITPLMKSRIDQAVRAYTLELNQARQAEVGADIPKIMQLAAGDAFTDGTRDVFAALDRLLERAAMKIESLDASLGLSRAQSQAYADLRRSVQGLGTTSEADRQKRIELTRAFFFDKLDIDAQKRLLEAVSTD